MPGDSSSSLLPKWIQNSSKSFAHKISEQYSLE